MIQCFDPGTIRRFQDNHFNRLLLYLYALNRPCVYSETILPSQLIHKAQMKKVSRKNNVIFYCSMKFSK